jgi:hypothetical protein
MQDDGRAGGGSEARRYNVNYDAREAEIVAHSVV